MFCKFSCFFAVSQFLVRQNQASLFFGPILFWSKSYFPVFRLICSANFPGFVQARSGFPVFWSNIVLVQIMFPCFWSDPQVSQFLVIQGMHVSLSLIKKRMSMSCFRWIQDIYFFRGRSFFLSSFPVFSKFLNGMLISNGMESLFVFFLRGNNL